MAKKKARSGPRRGYGYPVLPTWQEDVRSAIAKLGITEKAFAELVGCGQSTMHDLLHKAGSHSMLVPSVHKALNWDPPPDPQAPIVQPSADAIDMAKMFDRLPEHVRKKLRDDAVFYLAMTESPKDPTN